MLDVVKVVVVVGFSAVSAGGSQVLEVVGTVLGWLVNTAASALVGLLVGAVVVAVMSLLPFGHKKKTSDTAPTEEAERGPSET